MDNVWILYWITRLDSLNTLLVLTTVFSLLTAVFFIIVEESIEKGAINSFIVGIVSAVLLVFIPTKQDAMLIAAGVAVTEVVKSEAAGRIASKSVGVIEAWIDKQVEAKKEK